MNVGEGYWCIHTLENVKCQSRPDLSDAFYVRRHFLAVFNDLYFVCMCCTPSSCYKGNKGSVWSTRLFATERQIKPDSLARAKFLSLSLSLCLCLSVPLCLSRSLARSFARSLALFAGKPVKYSSPLINRIELCPNKQLQWKLQKVKKKKKKLWPRAGAECVCVGVHMRARVCVCVCVCVCAVSYTHLTLPTRRTV